MALAPEDDGFREIQLSGKQLVFLFMAATVVSVVIFLCGVLVGRGVRAERSAAMQADALTESPSADATPRPEQVAASEPDPREAVPPTPLVGEPEGTEAQNPTAPPLEEAPIAIDRSGSSAPGPKQPPAAAPSKSAAAKPAAAPVVPVPAPAPPPAAAKATTPPATSAPAANAPAVSPLPPAAAPAPAAAPVAASATDAPRTGYAVQVAAVDVRNEADAMVKRLTDKGYTAYVEQPKGSNMYRVRIGTYRTRREAQVVADKLKKEEKFKPWVTR